MMQCNVDAALYFLPEKDVLVGLIGTYEDDILRAGNQQFRRLTLQTNKTFDMEGNSPLSLEYMGFALATDQDMDVLIDQNHYNIHLECLPLEASLQNSRSMRMKLAWLSRSEPDCLFKIAQM